MQAWLLQVLVKKKILSFFPLKKAIAAREEYHQENCKNLQEKDKYRKQIREMGERYDELQIQLCRTQAEVVAVQAKFRNLQEMIGVSNCHAICSHAFLISRALIYFWLRD